MSTLSDITVTPDVWLNANTATGIALNSQMLIQSKGSYLLCQCKNTQPDADDTSGVIISPFAIYPAQDSVTVWLKAITHSTPVNIQQGS